MPPTWVRWGAATRNAAHAINLFPPDLTESMMDLPPHLKTAIEEGVTVLMLGSGASLAAQDERGNHPPTTKGLVKLLCDKYLSSEYEQHPLTQVADYSISEASLFEVQDFIRDIFLPFQPSESHKLIPSFRWRAIVTTNYDCLIEDAYHCHTNPVQRHVPLYVNTDNWDDPMRDPDVVPILKLHGCITRTHDAGCPLILSTEQYIDYTLGRSRIFNLFQQQAAQRSFLYVGFSNTDPDIRALIQQLDAENIGRKRSFLITPSVDKIVERYWSPRQITAMPGTFADIMQTLDGEIPKTFRGLRKTTPAGTLAISERFATATTELTETAVKALSLDLEYVKGADIGDPPDPAKFYSGISYTWGPIVQELDVRRRLHDTALSNFFLEEDPGQFHFLVVKAHAGAGKSTFLRRLAWEASHEFGRLCLYARSNASLSSSVLNDLHDATNEHIYLFVDDVVQHRHEVEGLVRALGSANTWLTIVGGARTNEWNGTTPAFQSIVTDEHQLPYLSDKELDVLIEKLEQHNALKELAKLPPGERRDALRQKAGRQLLVALHEATSGRRFEEILHDEYSRITPNKLKTLYLSICFLNQYNVPVRAGLIARRFGITFEEFRERFFEPLEDVVVTLPPRGVDDAAYVARHPHVAEMVVRNELQSVDDLFNEYLATIQELNVGYASDKSAFNKLMQGKRLAVLFPDASLASQLFDAAEGALGNEDPYLMQQMALFEMNRNSGNLSKATTLLEHALELTPRSKIIRHTLAELFLRKADNARNDLEMVSSIEKAESVCRELKKDAQDSYAHSTLIKAGLCRLRRAAESEEVLQTEDIEGLIKSIEKNLQDGQQRFPGDAHLLGLEADLAKLLSESERFAIALKQSFAKNPRNGYVAWQLAKLQEERGDIAEAQKTLRDAIDANRTNVRLHLAYGKLLLHHDIGTADDRMFHFKHSFTQGDRNYEAQLLYGRELFIAGKFAEAREVFSPLARVRLPSSVKRRHTYPLDGTFLGIVERSEAWYCLVRRDGDGAMISFDEEDSEGIEWRDISRHVKVRFKIAFTMFGPEAYDVEII